MNRVIQGRDTGYLISILNKFARKMVTTSAIRVQIMRSVVCDLYLQEIYVRRNLLMP